ncbi:MAG: hypothetical protein WKG32_18940 [Gemmatimonadaceae bacterium]
MHEPEWAEHGMHSRAENDSYAAWLISEASKPPLPATAISQFTGRVLRRVAEGLQTGDRDNSLQADLQFLEAELLDRLVDPATGNLYHQTLPDAANSVKSPPLFAPKPKAGWPLSPFHVSVAAEAFAAGLLAQAGCDVSVQYGANQPRYDLIAAKGDRMLQLSVKGSQDGGWGLVQGHKSKDVDYATAIDLWATTHSPRLVFCFVQFQGVALGECPRVYLATTGEVAGAMKASRNGHGNTTLREHYVFKKGVAAGYVDRIALQWTFSASRIDELLRAAG